MAALGADEGAGEAGAAAGQREGGRPGRHGDPWGSSSPSSGCASGARCWVEVALHFGPLEQTHGHRLNIKQWTPGGWRRPAAPFGETAWVQVASPGGVPMNRACPELGPATSGVLQCPRAYPRAKRGPSQAWPVPLPGHLSTCPQSCWPPPEPQSALPSTWGRAHPPRGGKWVALPPSCLRCLAPSGGRWRLLSAARETGSWLPPAPRSSRGQRPAGPLPSLPVPSLRLLPVLPVISPLSPSSAGRTKGLQPPPPPHLGSSR